MERPGEDSTQTSIASVLMKKTKSSWTNAKKDLCWNNVDQLYNELIDYLAGRNISWTGSVIEKAV